jgi:hypothetical protein
MTKTYWMIVVDQENLDITRGAGFKVLGVDSRNRRKSVRITPEDRLLYYVEDKKGFAATATVTSEYFEESTRIWKDHRKEELFSNRVKIKSDVVLEPEDYIDAREIAPTLEYVKKWSAERWPLAFLGMLHIVPQRDFNLLEEEIRKAGEAAKKRRPATPTKKSISVAAANRRRQKKKALTTRRRRRALAKPATKSVR